ncbi:MAG: hypothetical protein ACRDNK_07190 [Solirubrobacteraceae bacterium]
MLALTALTPASAAAFSKAMWGPVYRRGVNQFPLYQKLGVGIYEASLAWSEIAPHRPHQATNPSDPAYRWPTAIGQAVSQARRYHMRVLLQLIFTPRWANHHGARNVPPSNPWDYAAFAKAAAREYPGVHLWMIWGEPTRTPNFSLTQAVAPGATLTPAQQAAPHAYAQLLDDAYAQLKSVSRQNLVLGGSTWSGGNIDTQQWIENLRLPNGRRARMDIYAHNPFSNHEPSFAQPFSPLGEVQFSDLPELGTWIDRYLRRGMPIFVSEFTIPTAIDQEFQFYVDPPVAAQWVTSALRLSRQWNRIYGFGWIHVYDDPPLSNGGLLTARGRPKPDYYAFEHG